MTVFSAEVSGAAFAAAIARAAHLAPAAAKIPITGNALLRAGKDGLTIAATNLDQALTTLLEGEGSGAVTASAARLTTIAGRLSATAPVHLTATETHLTIKQGRATHRLPTLPAEDFPETLTEPLDEADRWQVPAEAFASALRRLEGCIDPNDHRFYLIGACLDIGRGEPAIAATDGNALGCIAVKGWEPPKRDSLILPLGAFSAIADIAKGAEVLDIGLTGEAVTVEALGRRLRTKLVAGDYPDWRRVVPALETRKTRVTVEADALAATLARVGIVEGDVDKTAKGKRRTASIVLEVGESEIVASSRNSAGEEAIDACPCNRDGDDVTIRIGTRLLNWAVPSLGDADTLELGFDGAGGPVTITRATDKDRNDLRIVMPMRL